MHAVIRPTPNTGPSDPYVFVQYQTVPNSAHNPPTKYLEITIGGGFKNNSAQELAKVADLLEEAWNRVQQGVDLLMRGTRTEVDDEEEPEDESP
jgi:hypothetical protein